MKMEKEKATAKEIVQKYATVRVSRQEQLEGTLRKVSKRSHLFLPIYLCLGSNGTLGNLELTLAGGSLAPSRKNPTSRSKLEGMFARELTSSAPPSSQSSM